jgi:hypothetical protein
MPARRAPTPITADPSTENEIVQEKLEDGANDEVEDEEVRLLS